MARPAGFEPATLGLEGRCSIQLSYGRSNPKVYFLKPEAKKNGRGREIRTPDPLLPKQLRYQAALCPDLFTGRIIRRAALFVNDNLNIFTFFGLFFLFIIHSIQ